MAVRRRLTAVNDAADCALKEGMYSVIKKIERDERIFILFLDSLCRLLESGKHGSFTARKVFSGVAVLTDLGEHILHKAELIRHERIGFNEIIFARISLQIQNSIIKSKQIFQHCAVFTIAQSEHFRRGIRFGKNTLFNYLVNR